MAEIISEELVDLYLDASNVEEAILQLAKKIDDAGRISEFKGYVDSVMEREILTSTGIGFGIAIPHGKCPYVKECTVAFGRLNESIDWNSLDGEPVKIVFLLAVPEECKGNEHLKIIASLSRKLIHEDFRENLNKLEDEKEIVSLITETLSGVCQK